MFNVKRLFNKNTFRLTIAVTAFLIITVASNLQIDTQNTNQFQKGQKVNLVKTIAQPVQTETAPTTEQTSEQDKAQQSSEEEQKSQPFFSDKLGRWFLFLILLGLLFYPGLTLYRVLNLVKIEEEDDFSTKAEFVNAIFPRVVEGITVILIVLVVTLLSLVEKIDPQGAISILSAVIGYVLGKQQRSREDEGNITPSPNGNSGKDGNDTQSAEQEVENE